MDDTAQAPVTLTREELYALVWELPMIRLGERFGISGTGLAKICKRLSIPYPQKVGKCDVCGAFHVHCLSLP
jgi:hypothetical protein